MKRTLPQLFGCFVGLLLCGHLALAQTQPGTEPAKPQTTQHVTQAAEADSAIDADSAVSAQIGINPVYTQMHGMLCSGPSTTWYDTQNAALLHMIHEAGGRSGVETEIQYEERHPHMTAAGKLQARIDLLKSILDSESGPR
uniref:Lipoprotein n=1 Tax=Acidobacterium capsulatum TaxID=33075 RepID=A0A7V4XT65_9BACT